MRYRKTHVLRTIGNKLQSRRKDLGLEIEDVVEMTGFNYNTIRKMERGSESTISYFIEVCIALGLHPKDVLDIPLELSARYPLSPGRKEKSRLTLRISRYLEDGYFENERSAAEVAGQLRSEFGIKTSSSATSVILNRLEKEGKLQSQRIGGRNFYMKRSS